MAAVRERRPRRAAATFCPLLSRSEVGAIKTVDLTLEQDDGLVDLEVFVPVPVESAPEDARKVGTLLVSRDGEGHEQIVRVHEARADSMIVDYNHPLAGQNLHFQVNIISVE